jgi:hypothetical protein
LTCPKLLIAAYTTTALTKGKEDNPQHSLDHVYSWFAREEGKDVLVVG